MQLQVQLHGLLTAGFGASGGRVELTLPEGADVASVIETLSETTPMFDPRSIMAVLGGTQVPLEYVLHDGNELHLYHLFSGG